MQINSEIKINENNQKEEKLYKKLKTIYKKAKSVNLSNKETFTHQKQEIKEIISLKKSILNQLKKDYTTSKKRIEELEKTNTKVEAYVIGTEEFIKEELKTKESKEAELEEIENKVKSKEIEFEDLKNKNLILEFKLKEKENKRHEDSKISDVLNTKIQKSLGINFELENGLLKISLEKKSKNGKNKKKSEKGVLYFSMDYDMLVVSSQPKIDEKILNDIL